MKKTFIIISILSLSLLLQACPAFFVKKLEEREAMLDSIRNNHYPTYLSKSNSYLNNNISNVKENDSTTERLYTNYNVNITSLDISEYPKKIVIEVVVSDTNGIYLTNLAPPFNIDYLDIWSGISDSCNGSKSIIRDLKIEEIQKDNSPKYAIAFLLDHSPSMGEDRVKKLQSGVRELVQYLKEPDMVSITKFTSQMYNSVSLTRDKFFVLDTFKVNGMEGIKSFGTYYFDAIEFGIKQLKKAPSDYKKIIIAFTDGRDSGSKIDKQTLTNLLIANDVKLFNVGYGYADVEGMKSLSKESKGKFYMTLTSKEFPYVLRDIYLKLSNYYRITYELDSCVGVHTVTIPINFEDELTEIIGNATYDIEDKTIRKKGDIVFLNIEFDIRQSAITDKNSLEEIRKVSEWMLANVNRKILIKGHTDNSGEKGYNQELSLKRASAVREQLVKLGIDKSRMSIAGFGSSKPLVPNDSEPNRQKNRRTEIEVVE
ncbi:MAG: OmpA family protein [Candidatus Kapaibacterium sp.]